jgi:hypothetical protein
VLKRKKRYSLEPVLHTAQDFKCMLDFLKGVIFKWPQRSKKLSFCQLSGKQTENEFEREISKINSHF